MNQLPDHKIWSLFSDITRIPRISGHEQEISDWVANFGRERGLETLQDEAGNVLIRKPAYRGMENRKMVILQSHLDMVGAKDPGSPHDFLKDPIKWKIDGNWVVSDGTTLGADDGIGMAASLAILDDKTLKHGPLECLFTVDEESGMTGARKISDSWLKGSILINLDSEDEGELYIGCAGGLDTSALFKFESLPVTGGVTGFTVKIEGLSGGHSGDEIHKGHANAIKILTRFLWFTDRKIGIRLAKFEGGTLRNAIPPEAIALFYINPAKSELLNQLYREFVKVVSAEYEHTDPNLKMYLKPFGGNVPVMQEQLQKRFLLALYGCPHGVYAWSKTIPDLVETSTNLAVVRMNDDDYIRVDTSQRSSRESGRADVAQMVASVFELAGARIEQSSGYPGWEPKTDSEILEITRKVYKDHFGTEPLVKAIHAGLECGLFLAKYSGLDMISFGPTIKGAHTPEEKLDIASTLKFWELLVNVLENIPEK